MTVRELMRILENYDQDLEIVGSCIDHTDFNYKIPISPENITIGDPIDDNGFSANGFELDEDSYQYLGPKVLLIDFGNV